MALKRFLWVAIPVVAAAGLAVAVLPPRPLPDRPSLVAELLGMNWYGDWYYGGGARWTILERDAKLAATNLRERVEQAGRGDSLIALAKRDRAALRTPDGLVTVLHDPTLPADTARRFLEAAARELALYPKGDVPGMPVIVALYTDSARHPDLRLVWPRRNAYVRDGARGSACIVELIRTVRAQRYDPRSGGWLLNQCAVYARFGPSERGARGWAWHAANALDGGYGWRHTLTDLLVQARRGGRPQVASWEWQPSWLPFFLDTLRWYRPGPFGWRWSACLGGGDSSCLVAAGLLGGRTSRWFYWATNPFSPGSVVTSLLAAGDVERFAAFWRAGTSYGQALEQAYGKPAATVLRDAARRSWTPAPHGPHVTTRVVSAALGWMVVALGLAIVAGRRRQVRG